MLKLFMLLLYVFYSIFLRFFLFSVCATAHAHFQQAVQPGEQQSQWEQGEPLLP